jgi:hypothetical protein
MTTEYAVRACANCPMHYDDEAIHTICQHPDAADAAGRGRGTPPASETAPEWCPLRKGPLLIGFGRTS